MAGVLLRRITCSSCGQPEAMVRVDRRFPDGSRQGNAVVRWKSGNAVEVGLYRCEACASVEAVSREVEAEEEKARGDREQTKGVRASDGRRVVAINVKKGGAGRG